MRNSLRPSTAFLLLILPCLSAWQSISLGGNVISRRDLGSRVVSGSIASFCTLCTTSPAVAVTLEEKIKTRKFEKPLFNLPPKEANFPDWLEGTFEVNASFGGYLFPNKVIKKADVVANDYTPGFKQLSIMNNADIGPPKANFKQRFVRRGSSIVDDKLYNLPNAMAGWLKDKSPPVEFGEYDPQQNPNRVSFVLGDVRRRGGTTRIELFTNARDTERVGDDTFLLSEYNRQASVFKPGADMIARELYSDYQQFWVYTRNSQEEGSVKANLLTAGYLLPTDVHYFEAPNDPVILYSHTYDMKRISA